MKKYIFRYGAMGAGKSRNLISVWYNYKELGLNPIVVIPSVIKGEQVISRDGQKISAIKMDNLYDYIYKNKVDCILVDEAQFLSSREVKALNNISLNGITVIAYGLRTTFKGELFEGSAMLMALADEIEEIPTLCNCGKKARMNLRIVDGKVDRSEDIVKLREEQSVSYVSVCRECYHNYYNDLKNIKELIKYDNTVNCK